MPALPTLTVTQAISDRILAAFTGQVDSTGATILPTTAYKTWLRASLVQYVTYFEGQTSSTALTANIPLT